MNYSFVGKSTVISEALKEKTTEKLSKLEKFLHDDTGITITFKVTKIENKMEVSIPLQKRTLRVEVRDTDMYAAIDQAVVALERQMRKHKTRLLTRSRRDKNYNEEFDKTFPTLEAEEGEIKILRSKKFSVKPLDAEEAIMEMELLGHEFYMFRNSVTDEINVIYKRTEENSYGLIEPGL